ncbi:MAG: hypothetical protein A2275_09745 [Bacteroidetes bacterium RIFOXYA12_FULL_35_11]|nr:MAG: hypothetical protein A2X01_02175 [Bacteroidetes bacterium GWF2_35_48]OFY82336.1 MAG: hypothetical protein A2275_09745 [Bacteroidetes bacterium RIFOXYA12_FULL_35_11]OFY97151.1 MAG: hypothetical protein A2491_07695 [Bacteroidetes bacterium RIFOXYC12_FULL_35_7]HBX49619.1 hypothetical protein [Bacteroidales bacterium]
MHLKDAAKKYHQAAKHQKAGRQDMVSLSTMEAQNSHSLAAEAQKENFKKNQDLAELNNPICNCCPNKLRFLLLNKF